MALEHLEVTIKEWTALDAAGLVLPPHLMPHPPALQEAAPGQGQQQQGQQQAAQQHHHEAQHAPAQPPPSPVQQQQQQVQSPLLPVLQQQPISAVHHQLPMRTP